MIFYQTNNAAFEKAIVRKMKSSVDEGKLFGALPTYLSKVFDCLDHELLTAKPSTCSTANL